MIIKITCTTDEYQAGLVYNVPDKKAQELIDADMAIEVVEDRNKLLADTFGKWKDIDMSDGVKEIRATTKKIKVKDVSG